MDLFKPSIIFADQDVDTLATLADLCRLTHQVHTVSDADELIDLVTTNYIHVVVCAQRMLTHTGVAILREVKRLSPASTRVLLTDYADLAMMIGSVSDDEIYRYITQPLQHDEVIKVIDSATTNALNIQVSQSDSFKVITPQPEKILVIGDGDDTYQMIKNQFLSGYIIYRADSIEDIGTLINTHTFGAVIANSQFQGKNILPLITTFKDTMPTTMTILLTEYESADALLSLVSLGKVYRCLPTSSRASFLEKSVEQALIQHRKYHGLNEHTLTTCIATSEERHIQRIQQYLANTKKREHALSV